LTDLPTCTIEEISFIVNRRRLVRLVDRTAIVTGASRGLGRAITLALAAEGATVVAAARTSSRGDDTLEGSLEETVEAAHHLGGRAVPVICDVAVDADLVKLVDAAAATGDLFVLVNNAAWTVPGKPGKRPPALLPGVAAGGVAVLDVPVWAARKQFEVNLFAPWRLMQLAVPIMASTGGGAIVNVSSEAARMPQGPRAYGASKLALEFVTRAVAVELEAAAISVHALVPSLPIDTPGLAWVGGAPGEHQSPEEFAEAVVRLALGDAAATPGAVVYSADVLSPSMPARGWLGGGLA
jgi:7-alpha-hydroxysteroid dehydrogenase